MRSFYFLHWIDVEKTLFLLLQYPPLEVMQEELIVVTGVAPVNVPRSAAIRLLRSLLPDVGWLLRYAEKEDNWIRFPPTIGKAINNGLGKYVELYEDEQRITVYTFFGLLGEEGAKELFKELAGSSVEEQVEFVNEAITAFDHLDEDGLRWPRTDAEVEAAKQALEALPPDEQTRVKRQGMFFMSGFLANFFQYISVMVHGEKLSALVGKALAGDSEAFVKAVQIDRNLLSYHKAFQDRMSRAHMEGEQEFLEDLAYRMRNPIAKGKIRYRELWFAFSILDTLRYLNGDHTHGALIELLREAGMDLKKNGIEDEGYFGKRLKAYRRFQEKAANLH
jgi:hypothetical protein